MISYIVYIIIHTLFILSPLRHEFVVPPHHIYDTIQNEDLSLAHDWTLNFLVEILPIPM
jgi:hypothetical protein